MLLRIIVILFSICCCCCSSVVAEKNFWNNDICTTDSECTVLKSCDLTFGCTPSAAKVGLLMFVCFLGFCAIIVAIAYLCRRNLRTTRFVRPHNQFLPQTVITTNPWNQQHPMGTTTTTIYPHPHNPYPNQFYANSVNPPVYSQMDPRMGAQMHFNQVPTAPAGYGYGTH